MREVTQMKDHTHASTVIKVLNRDKASNTMRELTHSKVVTNAYSHLHQYSPRPNHVRIHTCNKLHQIIQSFHCMRLRMPVKVITRDEISILFTKEI